MGQRAVIWFLLVVVLGGTLCSGCDKRRGQETSPVVSYDSLREDVVRRIQKGEISADGNGIAALPEELKDASTDGSLCISKEGSSGLLVGFNLSIGRGGKAEYLLYSEHEIRSDTKMVQMGSMTLNVAGKAGGHWYKAVRSGR